MYIGNVEQVWLREPSLHSSSSTPAAILQFFEVAVGFVYVVDSVYVAVFVVYFPLAFVV
jgi:hypothetical protein